ncbi:hypothetical protein XM38_019660 [Halomicronema hongdechloris C2206]|uniref:Uncharacterized protein n=1 Tax=Halomicronema hongdechloris C2206 TaxID=1641165 RepID=A0A1Z3HLP4_9CYAN|nr:hypothetical protein XM38_019660 [Halomicronema hongdechloris C2206]
MMRWSIESQPRGIDPKTAAKDDGADQLATDSLRNLVAVEHIDFSMNSHQLC